MIPPPRRARRGQPLIALAAILIGWVGIRSALWASSADDEAPPRTVTAVYPAPVHGTQTKAGANSPASQAAPQAGGTNHKPDVSRPRTIVPLTPADRPKTEVEAGLPPRVAAAHQLLFLAGVAALPDQPDEAAAARTMQVSTPSIPQMPVKPLSRSPWSADGWIMWRQGGNGYNLPGRGLPGAVLYSGAYGASQAGLVVRYRLDRDSPLRPALFLRGSSGYDRPRGEELAAGLAMRPVPRIPVAVMGEIRATRSADRTAYRPAFAVVTELPPADLSHGMRGEAYVQAGWVGGEGRTAFVDGQARLDKKVAKLGHGEFRLGAGAWGGAQRGTHRVDLGPSLRLDQPLGGINTRLSADYRLRVAGSAAPGSGVAVTFSAGF